MACVDVSAGSAVSLSCAELDDVAANNRSWMLPFREDWCSNMLAGCDFSLALASSMVRVGESLK